MMAEETHATAEGKVAPARFRWWRRSAIGALVFGAVGVLAAAGFGVSLALAATSDRVDLAHERDAVRHNAEQAAVTLATIDPREVQASLDRWQASATGPLLAELRRGRSVFAETIIQAKRSTDARVLASAVRNLDPAAGAATVLISMDVTTSPIGQDGPDKKGPSNEATRTPQRLELFMSRAGEVWKASGVRVVGIGG